MNEEEYLKACGWEQNEDGESGEAYWTHARRPSVRSGWPRRFTLAEAVDAQTAEDRARAAFVLARSSVTLSTSEPSADPLNPFRQSVDIDVSAWHIEAK